MTSSPTENLYRLLFERLPKVGLIETNASGIFTYFGEGAEAFFNCSKEDAVGRLHYRTFHDPVEMEACQNDPDFQARMASEGWSEEDWTVLPREGEPFQARVTLMRAPLKPGQDAGEAPGWIALYRRRSAE